MLTLRHIGRERPRVSRIAAEIGHRGDGLRGRGREGSAPAAGRARLQPLSKAHRSVTSGTTSARCHPG